MSVARFWRKIPQRYNLIGTRCTTCGRYFFPPRSLCPDCRRAGKIVDYKFAGTGRVVTFTVIRTASEQFEQLTPYVFAIVELDEGPRTSGTDRLRPGSSPDRDEGKTGLQTDRCRRREWGHLLRDEVRSRRMTLFFALRSLVWVRLMNRIQWLTAPTHPHAIHAAAPEGGSVTELVGR